jgi:L-fuconolactonase
MKVIDSHAHFWQPQVLRYDWFRNIRALNRPFGLDDYLTAAGDLEIEGIVFVEVDRAPEQGLAEAQWVASLPAPVAAIVAFAPLELGEATRPALDALVQVPKVKGIRRLIQSEASGFATQPDFVAGVRLLPEYNLSFDLCIRHYQLADVITLVDQCPDVSFVLDHIGKPNIAGHELSPWREDIARLAQYPNVHCKLSGLANEADMASWTPADLQPYVEHVLEVFGTERLMFGSDYPVCTLATTYARWLGVLQGFLAPLTDAQKQAIYADNARRFFRLNSGETT